MWCCYSSGGVYPSAKDLIHDVAQQRWREQDSSARTGGLHLGVLLFGLAGLFGKWLALPATVIVFGRTIVAAVALAGVFALTRRSRQRLRGFEWPFAAMGALLALHWFAFFRAIQLSTVAVGLLGFASFPVFVLILETTLLRTRRGVPEWAMAGVVLAGLVLLVPAPTFDNSVVQGLLWGLVAGLTFAALTVTNRLLAVRRTAGEIALWQTSVRRYACCRRLRWPRRTDAREFARRRASVLCEEGAIRRLRNREMNLHIGMVGLGRMGANMGRRLAAGGVA